MRRPSPPCRPLPASAVSVERRRRGGPFVLMLLGTTSACVACAMWIPDAGDLPLAVAPAQRAKAPPAVRPGTAPPTAEPVRGRPVRPRASDPALPPCGRLTGTPTRPAGFYFADRTVPGQVVLTFDDGPLHGKTRRLLAVLRARGLRATFFVVGQMINRRSYRVIQTLVRDGHILGNHTYHHDLGMARVDQAEARIYAEFQLTQAMVDIALLAESPRQFDGLRRRLLGPRAPVRFRDTLVRTWPAIERRWRAILADYGNASLYRMVYARPPGGNPFGPAFSNTARRAYTRAVHRAGLINVLWRSGTANDFRYLSREERLSPNRIARSIVFAARVGGILLIHDQIPAAGLAAGLDDVIRFSNLHVISLSQMTRRRYGCEPIPPLRP